jgi:hypothetical protein
MTFEEIDERYRDAALDDDSGDGWDDPAELSDEDVEDEDLADDEQDDE